MNAVAVKFPKEIATAKERGSMRSENVVAIAPQTTTTTVSAMTATIAWDHLTLAAYAMDREQFSNAVVPTSLKKTVTAMEIRSMRSAFAVAIVSKTRMATGSVTPSMTASANLMHVACATARVPSMLAAVTTFPRERAIVKAINSTRSGNVAAIVRQTRTTTESAMMWTIA
jgi:hypothetical protein